MPSPLAPRIRTNKEHPNARVNPLGPDAASLYVAADRSRSGSPRSMPRLNEAAVFACELAIGIMCARLISQPHDSLTDGWERPTLSLLRISEGDVKAPIPNPRDRSVDLARVKIVQDCLDIDAAEIRRIHPNPCKKVSEPYRLRSRKRTRWSSARADRRSAIGSPSQR